MMEKKNDNLKAIAQKILDASESGNYARGKEYYQEGNVRNVTYDGELIEAYCEGNSDYLLTLDCNRNIIECTCPSPYNPCKHAVALCLWLQKNVPLKNDDIKARLKKLTKDEIINAIIKDKEILEKFAFLLKVEQTEDVVDLALKIRYEPNNLYGFRNQVRMITKNILKNRNLSLAEQFFKRLISIYDHYPEDEGFEGVVFEFLESLSAQMKLSEEEVDKLINCCGHYSFFEDCIYEE